MQYTSFLTILTLPFLTSAIILPRALPIPSSKGEVKISAPQRVTGTFDCGMKRYNRADITCDSDDDGGSTGALFILEGGATLKNCIVGADQLEGVHCNGSCTIENVWWEKVCEDAITVLQTSGTTRIIGGGAQGASDKVIQHNGLGTVEVTNFQVDDFGKLYRSCGNCSNNKGPRKVVINGVKASGGTVLAGVNENYGDVATISNSCGSNVAKMCERYSGCDKSQGSCESKKLGTGFNGKGCVDGGGNKATC